MDALSDPAKTFDTSGKSAALIHHHAICKTPMALPSNRLFGAIAGKRSLPTIEVAPARARRMIVCALPNHALQFFGARWFGRSIGRRPSNCYAPVENSALDQQYG